MNKDDAIQYGIFESNVKGIAKCCSFSQFCNILHTAKMKTNHRRSKQKKKSYTAREKHQHRHHHQQQQQQQQGLLSGL